MNNKQLIDALFSATTGTSKSTLKRSLDDLQKVIIEQLQSEGKFTLQGIGTIVVVDSPEREGRNPLTGQKLTIPAKKRLKLKACKALKEAVA